MTTTQRASVVIDLHDYAGDYVADYDMDAIHADYAAALEAKLPDGVYITRYGDVFVDVESVAAYDEIDVNEVAESIDAAALFARHERKR